MCEAPTAVIGYRVRTAVEPSRREGFPYDAKTRASLVRSAEAIHKNASTPRFVIISPEPLHSFPQFSHIHPEIKQTLTVHIRLYFRQIVESVIIAAPPRIWRGGCQQTYPQVQWNNRPTTEARGRSQVKRPGFRLTPGSLTAFPPSAGCMCRCERKRRHRG